MSQLFNRLSRLVITFLPRSKHLLISWMQSPSAVILEPPKINSATVSPSIICDCSINCIFLSEKSMLYIHLLRKINEGYDSRPSTCLPTLSLIMPSLPTNLFSLTPWILINNWVCNILHKVWVLYKREVRYITCCLIALEIILPIYLYFIQTYLCVHYLYLYAFLSGELSWWFWYSGIICVYYVCVFVCVCIIDGGNGKNLTELTYKSNIKMTHLKPKL